MTLITYTLHACVLLITEILQITYIYKYNRLAVMSLGVAVQVVSIAHPKQVTVPLVKSDSVLNPSIRSMPTLYSSVDDIGNKTEAWNPAGRLIGRGWAPLPRDDIMG